MGDKIDVFIIDDDIQSRQYFQAIINKGDGVRCIGSTSSGEKAVDIVITAYPDVVLIDYALYPISGFEVLVQLKQEMPTVPIILLGGRANLADKAREAGADAYLPMPITPRTLIDTIFAVSSVNH
ncbi:MAG: response regulator [Chloroflexota bacterium]